VLTHGSLFSGYGGIDRGFARAGIKTIWRVELLDGKDITKENPAEYAVPDVLSGGPPCQKTSRAAALHGGRTLESLWPHMLRFVSALRPKCVLVEQPLGGQSIIVQAAQELQRIGYGCAGRIINSEHWVPQRRQRWFLIARMGVSGMALWNHLYVDGERVEGRESSARAQQVEGQQIEPRMFFDGSCPDCVRDGIFAGISARKLACVGAGNAVTEPVAEWIGRRIVEAVADGR